MLESLGARQEAVAIEAAVNEAVITRHATPDIGGTFGTRETGGYIASLIRRSPRRGSVPRNDLPASLRAQLRPATHD